MEGSLTVRELAGLLEASFEGDGSLRIRSATALDTAAEDQVSFVGSRKAAEAAAHSHAGCLIVPADFPSGRTLIRAGDPRAAFALAIPLLHPSLQPAPGVHPLAAVAADAEIGEGTSIGPGCSIGPRVRIGRECILHANVSVYHDAAIGNRVTLHSGCVIGADGFGFVRSGARYQKFPQIGRVEIGDDVEIGANSCIDRAALGVTSIGEGTKLDNLVHVGHNCAIGRHVVVAAQTGFSGGVVVEDYAIIGGQVGVGDKARIQAGVVLGSKSGVLTSKIVRNQNEPLWGVPARPLRQYLEQLAGLARLPKLRAQVSEIARRLDELAKRVER